MTAFTPRPAGRYPGSLLLDLDGVVFRGTEAIPGAVGMDAAARAAGTVIRYVTNNASRTPAEVAAKLAGLGLAATPQDVVTSAVVASDMLASWRDAGRLGSDAVAVVGGRGLFDALRAAGFDVRPARDTAPGDCPVLVQGFSPDLQWADLAAASYLVADGITWLATNLDPTIPTDRGIAPGNGTLVGTVTAATGRRPDAVAGKPDPEMARRALAHAGTGPGHDAVFVGDRLDTDIACGRAAGITTMLVLSGVHGLPDLLAAPAEQRPDLLGDSLPGLLDEHPAAGVLAPGRGVCRDATAVVGTDVGMDVGMDVGTDVGSDVGSDVGTDVSTDVGASFGAAVRVELQVAGRSLDGQPVAAATRLDLMRALAVAVWSLDEASAGTRSLASAVARSPQVRALARSAPVDNAAGR